jgi:hypothetical protein
MVTTLMPARFSGIRSGGRTGLGKLPDIQYESMGGLHRVGGGNRLGLLNSGTPPLGTIPRIGEFAWRVAVLLDRATFGGPFEEPCCFSGRGLAEC